MKKLLVRVVLAGILGAVLAVGFLWLVDNKDIAARAAEPMTPEAKAAQIERGRYLAIAGDCVACHTREGGEEFAGGLPLITPFGTIYAPNITPDPETGIGGWRERNFIAAMRTGRHLGGGRPILPPMPWHAYKHYTDSDLKALFAWLKAQPAVRNRVPEPVPPAR